MSAPSSDPMALREVDVFVNGRPRAVAVFRVVYLLLTLNFAAPVVTYLFDRHVAESTVSRLNVALGGQPLFETGELWHMLAIGNVATLAFLCALLWLDLRRAYVALPALIFLKATSALTSLGLAFVHGLPAFLAIFVLDAFTTVVIALSAQRAFGALFEPAEEPLPLWSYLLVHPRAIRRTLRRVEASGRLARVPTLFQVLCGVVRMTWRLIARPNTIGTSRAAVRRTTRARILAPRPLRFVALLWERAIAPCDLSGLASPPDRIVRHVLGAHHDDLQLVYDLELLSLHPGWLERLRDAARAVVAERTPRATFLKDLCVFEGYHEEVLALTEAALAGRALAPARAMDDPDISLFAYLAWCSSQPTSPLALLAGHHAFPQENPQEKS